MRINWYKVSSYWFLSVGIFYILAVMFVQVEGLLFAFVGINLTLPNVLSAVAFFVSSYFISKRIWEVPFGLLGVHLCWSFYIFSLTAIAIDFASLALLSLTMTSEVGY